MGHIDIYPLEAVHNLQGLWISIPEEIIQTGRKPHLIYYFSWSGLNEQAKQDAPREAMRFSQYIHCLLVFILEVEPALGPDFLSKADLDDAYMCICIRLANIPSVAFLIPREREDKDQIVGFHLSITMGYV